MTDVDISKVKVCSTCTFFNTLRDHECVMCGTTLGSNSDVNCPVCGRIIPVVIAEDHVNECLMSTNNPSSTFTTVASCKPIAVEFDKMVTSQPLDDMNVTSVEDDSKIAKWSSAWHPSVKSETTTPCRERTLTSIEQIELLKVVLQLTSSLTPWSDLWRVMRSLYSHMTTEKREERESKAKGNYLWEYEVEAEHGGGPTHWER